MMRTALTQSQAAELLRAASLLPPASRGMFLAEVDDRLRCVCRRELTDDDVQAAIIGTLSGFDVIACQGCK